jgi:hypothetical protein
VDVHAVDVLRHSKREDCADGSKQDPDSETHSFSFVRRSKGVVGVTLQSRHWVRVAVSRASRFV